MFNDQQTHYSKPKIVYILSKVISKALEDYNNSILRRYFKKYSVYIYQKHTYVEFF